jgi:hypothetical protein
MKIKIWTSIPIGMRLMKFSAIGILHSYYDLQRYDVLLNRALRVA